MTVLFSWVATTLWTCRWTPTFRGETYCLHLLPTRSLIKSLRMSELKYLKITVTNKNHGNVCCHAFRNVFVFLSIVCRAVILRVVLYECYAWAIILMKERVEGCCVQVFLAGIQRVTSAFRRGPPHARLENCKCGVCRNVP